ncbi:MAG: LuxR C-terminal-related transcriptional regulator [Xanthobacteraceae bacterium]|nr:LuxR C-terminal-related transcriptional regulator [Xanthobacteraceae bacterium]
MPNIHTPIRRAEILAALSLATDLAMGQPMEFALKSCALGIRLGKLLQCDESELKEIYYHSLLRYINCNAETHVMAALFGDEIDFRRDYARIDPARASEMVSLVFGYLRRANADSGIFGMIAGVTRGLVAGKKASEEGIAGHCEVAERLAERLGLSESVRRNLGQLYERWDGRGLPNGLKGEAIAPAVRIVSFAQDVIVLRAAYGDEETRRKIEKRKSSAYEPRLVNCYFRGEQELLQGIDATGWEDVLSLEPSPQAALSDEEFDEACRAMADFADLKSPYSVGHSRAVAALAAEAGKRCGLPAEDVAALRRAGFLHDIGQVGVPARIWLKRSPFNDSDWEQARLHTYYGERVLSRPAALAALGTVVAQHHERVDGSGYHRGARGGSLSPQGKILAAAESYQNKIEARPHRAAFSAQAAADALKRESREGKLDSEAVAAVLAAAGHAAAMKKEMMAGLTAREVEVLRSIARGRSTKEIARRLGVSPKTIDNHTQSIYSKIGVKTRGGATLYAIERGLCEVAISGGPA